VAFHQKFDIGAIWSCEDEIINCWFERLNDWLPLRWPWVEEVEADHEGNKGMVFDEILVDQWADILNHKSQDRHEVIIEVIDEFELNWFNLSSYFHLCLNSLTSLLLNIMNFLWIFGLLFLLFIFLFLFILLLFLFAFLQSFHIILHDDIEVEEVEYTSKENNRLGLDTNISSQYKGFLLLFIVSLQLAR